jgi:hypothetical protein
VKADELCGVQERFEGGENERGLRVLHHRAVQQATSNTSTLQTNKSEQ